MKPLPAGIYDRLIDRDTRELLEAHPELRSVLKKIDAEEVPARFAAFVADVVEKALQLHESTEDRLKLCNDIIGHLSASEATAHLDGRHLSGEVKNVLAEVSPAAFGTATYPRPATPIWESSLFGGWSGMTRSETPIGEFLLFTGSDGIHNFLKLTGPATTKRKPYAIAYDVRVTGFGKTG